MNPAASSDDRIAVEQRLGLERDRVVGRDEDPDVEVAGAQPRELLLAVHVTDARPDTGGLSGATPGEAVSWGKVDPDRLPDAVVCYVDSTVALPLITAYALTRHEPREPKRLYEQREQFMSLLLAEYKRSKRR